jgi:hypothetical protein
MQNKQVTKRIRASLIERQKALLVCNAVTDKKITTKSRKVKNLLTVNKKVKRKKY